AASRLPLVVAADVGAGNATFESVVVRQAFEVALMMLPMTVALGAAFPLALATASSGPASIGADTARVYAANTLGAIAASLAAGFLLVPRSGLHAPSSGTSRIAIAGAVAVAAWASLGGRTTTRTRGLAVIGALTAVGIVLAAAVDVPPW